jgi:hypothetical protein
MAGHPNDAAVKARIIGYMNSERRDSLEDYLRFYNQKNAIPRSTKLVDFGVDFMKIEYTDKSGSKQVETVKISPPMSSLSDSRGKFEAMAEDVTGKSFHRSSEPESSEPSAVVSISIPEMLEWTPPKWPGYIALIGISFGFWALSHDYPLSTTGPLQAILPSIVVEYSRRFRGQFFAAMLGIHIIEASIVAGKCFRAGASLPISVLWTVNGFFEGGPAIVRINKLIEKRAAERR